MPSHFQFRRSRAREAVGPLPRLCPARAMAGPSAATSFLQCPCYFGNLIESRAGKRIKQPNLLALAASDRSINGSLSQISVKSTGLQLQPQRLEPQL